MTIKAFQHYITRQKDRTLLLALLISLSVEYIYKASPSRHVRTVPSDGNLGNTKRNVVSNSLNMAVIEIFTWRQSIQAPQQLIQYSFQT